MHLVFSPKTLWVYLDACLCVCVYNCCTSAIAFPVNPNSDTAAEISTQQNVTVPCCVTKKGGFLKPRSNIGQAERKQTAWSWPISYGISAQPAGRSRWFVELRDVNSPFVYSCSTWVSHVYGTKEAFSFISMGMIHLNHFLKTVCVGKHESLFSRW